MNVQIRNFELFIPKMTSTKQYTGEGSESLYVLRAGLLWQILGIKSAKANDVFAVKKKLLFSQTHSSFAKN